MSGDAVIFPLGQLCATPAAMSLIEDRSINLPELLVRHQHGDWGEVPPEDARTNERARATGGRILSSYGEPGGRLWIITEGDRSVTTVLLPEDY